jgi:excisionase family DNA binding protein
VLTVGEAAQRLGISRQELDARIERGEVATLKAGMMTVVPLSEVERPKNLS